MPPSNPPPLRLRELLGRDINIVKASGDGRHKENRAFSQRSTGSMHRSKSDKAPVLRNKVDTSPHP